MATTVKESFRLFARDVNITDRQEEKVANCRRNVVSKLKAELELHPEESRVIGSWDRDTMVRYLSEADVDVMVILHYGQNKHWNSPEGTGAVLRRFKEILDAAYPKTPCKVDRNCVTMELSEFRLDVVPAFPANDAYEIPDTDRRSWRKTDPIEFQKLITAVNKNMDGAFVPFIKMVKAWNRNVGWPIRSFHLECMMHAHYRSHTQGYSHDSMANAFLGALPGYLKKPCFDPVVFDQVDDYLGFDVPGSARQRAIGKAEAAAALAREAYEDGPKYPAVAIGEWEKLFGEFFPTYG
jgi:hypothetical protein